METKSIPIPSISRAKPVPKIKKAWLAVFAQVDPEEDPEYNEGILSENTYYDHKPTDKELQAKLSKADDGWELISLLEVKL